MLTEHSLPPETNSAERRVPGWSWAALAVTAATITAHNAFSNSKIFFYRDLQAHFWPIHLWLRRTIADGHFPTWEPKLGLGAEIIGHPNLQLLFLPTLVLRLLLPEALAFNLAVALPMPVAALGLYLCARTHAGPRASALGAVVFAASGTVVSGTNALNELMCIALIPWVLWAAARLTRGVTARGVALLALLIALQALTPDLVVLAGTAVLAVAYAAALAPTGEWRERARLVAAVGTAGVVGAMLAAVQLLPFQSVAAQSMRGEGRVVDGWSTHPLSLVEAVAPTFLGSALDSRAAWSPWLTALNNGREPYIDSLYVGAGAILLALLGVTAGRPRRLVLFWCVVFVVSLVLALGFYTPVYPALREMIPLLHAFRFPSRYTRFATLALALLVVAAWEALERAPDGGPSRRQLSVPVVAGLAMAAAGAFVTVVLAAAPGAAAGALARLAAACGLPDPSEGAAYLSRSLLTAAPRLAVLAAVAAACLWLAASGRRDARLARWGLFALVAVDLVATNASLNPTIDAALLGEPEWVAATRAHPEGRIFIGQTFLLERTDPDVPPPVTASPDVSQSAVSAVTSAVFSTLPMAWGIPEVMSIDPAGLKPREHTYMEWRFSGSDGEARMRFLRRAGVRYFLMPRPPSATARPLVPLRGLEPMVLYEEPAPAPRAVLVPRAAVEPDVHQQINAMFAEEFDPSAVVLLEAGPPEPSGAPGAAAAPFAAIVADDPASVLVRASAPEGGGYVVLLDAYDKHWRAEVDGEPAPLLRANGLFRAVRVAAGEHEVRFEYHSPPLLAGGAISATTALALLAAVLWPRRKRVG